MTLKYPIFSETLRLSFYERGRLLERDVYKIFLVYGAFIGEGRLKEKTRYAKTYSFEFEQLH